jgi:hypothetical protein
MRCKIEIDDAKRGRQAILDLADKLTHLTAFVLQHDEPRPLKMLAADGDIAITLTFEDANDAAGNAH